MNLTPILLNSLPVKMFGERRAFDLLFVLFCRAFCTALNNSSDMIGSCAPRAQVPFALCDMNPI